MRFSRSVYVVDAHAEGESGKVVVGGVPRVRGTTMFEKMKYFEAHFDDLRKLLLFEPRGAVWHNANVIIPSENPAADMGYIIMESAEYPVMSGSNTICVATVLLETGMLPMVEPMTTLVLESPAGLITVKCECENGKVVLVKLTNQPAFVYRDQVSIEVDGLGSIAVDVAFGGMTSVLVDATEIGLSLDINNEAALCELGQRIKHAAAEQVHVEHPENPLTPGISQTVFTGPVVNDRDGDSAGPVIRSKNAVVISPGRIDRSPCGTGTSARLAVLHARGEIAQGQLFRHESLIGTKFDARIEAVTTVGGYPAVVPSISGRAWITSFNQLVLDPSDPFPAGFTVGRPWNI